MRTKCFINWSLLMAALALATIPPGSAAANSLLSGYGGPGQGNQEILGAALVNGPTGTGGNGAGAAGGGGTGAPASGASSLAVASAAGASQGAIVAAGSPAARGSHAPAPRGRGGSAGRAGAATTAAGSRTAGSTPVTAVSRASAGGGGTLGLSGADLLFILLALGALLLTGVLTRKFAQPREIETQAR